MIDLNYSNNQKRGVQLKELVILRAFKRVCEKNNLTYFLCGGTLLGAVRHKGFIPWDDDIDVCMPYADYRAFLKIAQDELGKDFFVQNSETEDYFPSPFTKIRLNKSTFLDSAYSKWHINHGIWIDIFPVISISRESQNRIQRILKICKVMQMDDLLNSNPEVFEKLYSAKTIKRLAVFYRIVPLKLRKQIHKTLLRQVCCNSNKAYCSELIGSQFILWPKDVFGKATTIEFEGELFSAPLEYDTYLRIHYGDYMQLPPENQRVGLHADIIDLEHSYNEIYESENDSKERC